MLLVECIEQEIADMTSIAKAIKADMIKGRDNFPQLDSQEKMEFLKKQTQKYLRIEKIANEAQSLHNEANLLITTCNMVRSRYKELYIFTGNNLPGKAMEYTAHLHRELQELIRLNSECSITRREIYPCSME